MRNNPFFPVVKCTFCGNDYPTGLWYCESLTQVFCCSHCAVHVLPSLASDAIAEQIQQLLHFQARLKLVKENLNLDTRKEFKP